MVNQKDVSGSYEQREVATMATKQEQYKARLASPEFHEQERVLEGVSGDLLVNPTLDGTVQFEVCTDDLGFISEVLEDSIESGRVLVTVYPQANF
jgi:hypothetical protein